MYDFKGSWEFPKILISHTQIPKINIDWEFGSAFWSFNISQVCIPSIPQGHCSNCQNFVIFSDLMSQPPGSSNVAGEIFLK